MNSNILKAGVAMLRGIYAPMKLCAPKNRITIISRQSNEPSRDIALLSDYIRKNYPQIQCRVMCRKLEKKTALSYGFHMLAQMKSIASSKLVILDGYCIAASVLNHREETKIIQMWHALAAIKQFGYQTIDKPSGHSRGTAEALHMHENYDYIIAPSEETGRLFCKGFGAGEDKLVYYGLPRIDDILEVADAKALREEFGIPENREIILYAPTFRKGEDVPLDELKRAVSAANNAGKAFTCVVKLHPLYADSFKASDLDGSDIIIDNKYSTYDWLKVCDGVITDYSALGVEASLTGKPLYFFLYDLEEYMDKVGLNINPAAEMPQATAKSSGELAKLLAGEYDFEALERFRNKYISVDTDECTAKLGDFAAGIVVDR